MKVAIFFGSQSDTDKMKGAANCLREFGIEFWSICIISSQRLWKTGRSTGRCSEKRSRSYHRSRACSTFTGVIASKTVLPVVGVPLNGAIGGLDALYSIVQMPKSIPVATVGIDNSYNAGMLAVPGDFINKISGNKRKTETFRKEMKAKFIADNEKKIEI